MSKKSPPYSDQQWIKTTILSRDLLSLICFRKYYLLFYHDAGNHPYMFNRGSVKFDLPLEVCSELA